ncbi:MAG: methyltransferase domain-containing protein [Clostridia bacterium]|nr:methyltransferase domain-containing protein [Clostridia bacterium]
MTGFRCPVCRAPLTAEPKRLVCPAGHSYDRAKSGYVNLLQSQRSGDKRHGDDALMVRARRAFLNGGGYGFLCDEICARLVQSAPENAVLLDVGCGEGYYTAAAAKALADAGKPACVLGVDISKDALRFAASRLSGAQLAVASAFALPLADASCDVILQVFAPAAPAEFLRVLRPGGLLLRVIPLEEHLLSLKAAIYEHPYANTVPPAALPGFRTAEETALRRTLRLEDPAQIRALFQMTPYYYKTSRTDQAKLDALTAFETEAAFGLRIYRKEE